MFNGFKSVAQCDASYQYKSKNNLFFVDNKKGCVGLTVSICSNLPSNDCVSGDPCDIDFGDEVGSDKLSHTFSKPGNYVIKVNFGNNFVDEIEIIVLDKKKPNYNIFVCNNYRINIEIQQNDENSSYDFYQIDFGLENKIISSSNPIIEHQYSNNFERTITISGFDNNSFPNCPSKSKNIIPISKNSSPSLKRLIIKNNNQAILETESIENKKIFIEVEKNDVGGYTIFDDLLNLSTTLTGFDFEKNSYCFRLLMINPCDNSKSYSNSICSINASIEVQDGQNILTWSSKNISTNLIVGRKYILDDKEFDEERFAIVNSFAKQFSDINIQCGINYQYYLMMEKSGTISVSDTVQGVAIDKSLPDSIEDVSISIEQNGLLLNWVNPIGELNNVFKIQNDMLNKIVSLPTYSINSDSIASSQQCFNIINIDMCENSSLSSLLFCSIFLQGSINSKDIVELFWNKYNGFKEGVDYYEIRKYYHNQYSSSEFQTDTALIIKEETLVNQYLSYEILAHPKNKNLTHAKSNKIHLVRENNIFFPSSFTPNSDGLNDIFLVNCRFASRYHLEIFNRWGQVLYVSNDSLKGWDGFYKDKLQQQGTYLFNLTVVDLIDKVHKKQGAFLLLNN